MSKLKQVTQAFDFSELAQLIEINSYTKNKAGVDKVAQLFSQWMQPLGFSIKRFERENIGDHILYLSNKVAGKKILLLGHFDTVFPPDTFDSFSEDDNWIYGPGVCDMKGGNYVALCALRQVFEQFGCIENIDVLMVSDEESGSDDSKHITQAIAKDYDLCLVFEAAGKDNEVVIARKGVATYQIDIKGKAAHAGNHYHEGCNANLAAAHMIVQLTALTRNSFGTTVNAGKVTGGIGANTISPHANITVEARFTNNTEKERVLSEIERIATTSYVTGVSSSFSGGLQRDVMQTNQNQVLLIKEIEEIIGKPLKLEKRGGVSDANTVAGQGVPTLDGFGPFGDGDHTIHERASKASFHSRVSDVSKILTYFTKQGAKKELKRKAEQVA
ncbi:M20 family metallopeptidase [Litorilituus sediminis]|uniref:M20 family peptidase n=1 Tax=Litorilituus sediminis TaxID=718192 RepID=A0A4P6P2L8_9GAMM|nr:M20 family metallopeptidase [Litorilituus sediminis]QBG35394.1 M20 family peptidase [Litorilituus sediminis]